MADYARKEGEIVAAVEEKKSVPADEPKPVAEEKSPVADEKDKTDAKQLPNPLDTINSILASLNITTNGTAPNATTITQGLVTLAQQVANNLAQQQNQATQATLNAFNSLTNALLNLPNIFRFPTITPSQKASADEAQFKKISSESPGDQKVEKPVIFIPRRPEYYPYYYGGQYGPHPYSPYLASPYYQPAPYYAQPAPFGFFRGHGSSQFRRPVNPTADDDSLSDLEALAQLEELLAKGDEEGYYREAEARGLLSSLSTGASSVRAGFKNIFNSISAALPTVVYKTLVVPSLASGGSSP